MHEIVGEAGPVHVEMKQHDLLRGRGVARENALDDDPVLAVRLVKPSSQSEYRAAIWLQPTPDGDHLLFEKLVVGSFVDRIVKIKIVLHVCGSIRLRGGFARALMNLDQTRLINGRRAPGA